MHRVTSASSEQDESNDTMQQEDYAEKSRILLSEQNKMKAKEDDVNKKMKKLREEQVGLEKDNEDLETNLKLAESDANKRTDEKGLNKLNSLVIDYDRNAKLIEEENQKRKSLDSEIRKYERLMNEKKKAKDEANSNSKQAELSEVRKQTDRKTLALENRYEKQVKNYNDTLTQNSALREDIERLRNDRVLYNEVYEKLYQELENLRLEKAEITLSATQAYEQRDEANSKCVTLKEKNDKDRAQHDMEMRDLQRRIDHDYVLQEFMTTKSDERFTWKKKSEERRRKHGSSGEIAQKQQRKQIMSYEKAFNRIKEITEEEDIDILVENFIRNEDDNFAQFQYVSELNNKIETLREDIMHIKEEIQLFELEEDKLESERHKILKDLESQLNSKKEEADNANIRLTEINKVLDQVREAVKSIFKKIGCDETVILDILGGDSSVTNRNVMLYLGSVEQRTNALLSVLYYTQVKANAEYRGDKGHHQKKDKKQPPPPPPDHGMTLGLSSEDKGKKESIVYAPVLGDDFVSDSDDSGDQLRPFSASELYEKAKRDMVRKQELGGTSKSTKNAPDNSNKKKIKN